MRKYWVALVFSTLVLSGAAFGQLPKFSNVTLDESFRPYLLSNPILMEIPGTKVVREKGGRTVVLSVSSTVLKDHSPDERLRAEKVCKIKALAGVVAESRGIQVYRIEKVEEKTQVNIENGAENARSVSDLLELTKTKVQGIVKDMPVIGRWMSADGQVFYLGIGCCLDKDGNVVELGKPNNQNSK